MTKPSKWIKPILINSLNLNNIYLIIFKFIFKLNFKSLSFYLDLYKFGEGLLLVSIYNLNNNNYMEEVTNYSIKNNLVNIIIL